MEDKLMAEIIRVSEQLAETKPTDKEYKVLIEQLERLFIMRAGEQKHTIEMAKVGNDAAKIGVEQKKVKAMNKLNPNDIIGAAVNLTGIGMILNHEKLNVISTKALSFVKRLRF